MHETPVEDLRAALAAHAIPATTPIHHRQDSIVAFLSDVFASQK
jgi:acetyl esterase